MSTTAIYAGAFIWLLICFFISRFINSWWKTGSVFTGIYYIVYSFIAGVVLLVISIATM